MSHRESSLPDSWVERIWLAMRATYGSAFDRQWQCPDGEDPARHVAGLKAHWGRELARFQQNPEAIRYAIENLPARPPNLIEFRVLCNSRPDPVLPALPAPKPDPERVAAALAGLRKPGEEPQRDMKAWAHKLRARELAGERIGIFHRSAWREALGFESGEAA